MKNLKATTTILAIAFLGFSASCKENRKNVESNAIVMTSQQSSQAKTLLADYMAIKDALVADDSKAAATAAKQLESSLAKFNVGDFKGEQQAELKKIIADAKEHAEHISKSEISHQREHFKSLSIAIMDMVTVTGTEMTLYQQFCPMYDRGSAWLSMSKDIKNPYYGSKMLTCGTVKKEIN